MSGKTIHFFHFKTLNENEFNTEDTTYCKNYGQTYPYTIKYYRVSSKLSGSGMDNLRAQVKSISEMDENFNQILFFTSIEDAIVEKRVLFIKTVSEHKIEKAFIAMLKGLKEYIKNATAFIRYENDMILYVSRSLLKDNGIHLKKFLNISAGDATQNAEIFLEDGNKFDYKYFARYQFNEPKLVCNNWFIYFSDIAFGCVKNRLLQISSTCYLNTILNGIILCPTARKVALNVMKKIEKSKYISPLNLDMCGLKDEYYLFRLVYNMICSNVVLKDTSAYMTDIIVQYSKLYSPDKTGGGQGGYIHETFGKLIKLIDPDFIELYYPNHWYTGNGTLSDIVIKKRGGGDFLFIYPGGEAYDNVNYNDTTYVLQFAFITLTNKGFVNSHSVVGIICDGQYIIFDSNGDMVNIDWRHLIKDIGTREVILEYINRTYPGIGFTDVIIDPVYIKQSTIKQYDSVSSDSLCKFLN